MPYTALPDRRMPYDNDGTVFGYRHSSVDGYQEGFVSYLTGSDLIEANDDDNVSSALSGGGTSAPKMYLFFPESREVTAYSLQQYSNPGQLAHGIQASADSTNGMDGTWETASLPGGECPLDSSLVTRDFWRATIKPLSFTGGKRAFRIKCGNTAGGGGQANSVALLHVYGEKFAGQTPDDVIYINHDDTPGAEFTAPEDFGDQPLGTTVVRQFRVKNTSATKTANTINIQCNDTDFAISTDGSTWVVTINIASLAAGAESATMYVRCTTPAVGSVLGPRFNRIITTVASYT